MSALLSRFVRDESGATAVEYALIGVLVFLAALGGMQAMGANVTEMWAELTDAIVTAQSS